MQRMVVGVLILILAAVLGSTACQSADTPISAGSKMLGGQFLFSNMGGDLYEVNDERITLLQMNPYLGVFVSDGFNLGSSIALQRSSTDRVTASSFGIGPRVAYFFGETGPGAEVRGKTYPVIGMTAVYTRGSIDIGSADATTSGVSFAFGAGLIHMVSSHVGLSFEAVYQIDDMTTKIDYPYDDYEESESGDKFNIGIGIVSFLY